MIPVLVALLACIKQIPADLYAARPEPAPFGAPRPCRLSVAPVIDARPTVEREAERTVRTKYFVPAILWFQWASAGPRYAAPDMYAANLTGDLGALLGTVLDEAAVCSGDGPTLTVRPTLRHYFGLAYEKSMGFASYGGGMFLGYGFWPLGQATLELELLDGDRVLGKTVIDERYLFNPADPGMSTAHSAAAGAAPSILEARKIVPRVALQRVLAEVPLAVDRMLAEVPGARIASMAAPVATPAVATDGPPLATVTGAPLALPVDPLAGSPGMDPPSFLVIRLTREYDFQEEMRIETPTGRIISDRVVRRRFPVISAPDEWVVAPVGPDGHWLSDEAYRAMLDRLELGYALDRGTNQTAARFLGMAGGAR